MADHPDCRMIWQVYEHKAPVGIDRYIATIEHCDVEAEAFAFARAEFSEARFVSNPAALEVYRAHHLSPRCRGGEPRILGVFETDAIRAQDDIRREAFEAQLPRERGGDDEFNPSRHPWRNDISMLPVPRRRRRFIKQAAE